MLIHPQLAGAWCSTKQMLLPHAIADMLEHMLAQGWHKARLSHVYQLPLVRMPNIEDLPKA